MVADNQFRQSYKKQMTSRCNLCRVSLLQDVSTGILDFYSTRQEASLARSS